MAIKDVEKLLKKLMKNKGEIPDKVMERLEDVYGVDLTHEYGEGGVSVVKRILRKIK